MPQDTTPIIFGLATVIYQVADVARAKDWYARAFGQAPYFDQPFYVGFEIGGYELGLHPDLSEGEPGPGGSVAYWRVPQIDEAVGHFEAVGATVVSAARDVGDGIRVAKVTDPFGNVIGLIENPHFAIKSS